MEDKKLLATNSSFLGLKYLDYSTTDTVNAGEHEYLTIQPPKGQVWKLNYVILQAPDPVGSSSGTQSYELDYTPNGTTEISIADVTGNTGTSFIYISRLFFFGDTENPPLTDNQNRILQSIKISNSIYLKIDYFNNTDVNQTGSRLAYFIFDVYKELL